jgi:5,10-methylenetetrahydromethanopterin reductase
VLTYDFRLPPGPRTVEYALLAEELGFRAVWCPEIPAFGHDTWVTLARIAERTKRIKFGPSVLIPSYRHPMAQASAIATLEQIAPGRLMVGFGTGFTGRAGMGKKPLSLASMRTHIAQVKALLRGDIADIDGGLAQILASDGWLPDRDQRLRCETGAESLCGSCWIEVTEVPRLFVIARRPSYRARTATGHLHPYAASSPVG